MLIFVQVSSNFNYPFVFQKVECINKILRLTIYAGSSLTVTYTWTPQIFSKPTSVFFFRKFSQCSRYILKGICNLGQKCWHISLPISKKNTVFIKLIASTKETLPNWVAGCSVSSWAVYACCKREKSRKWVVGRFQIYAILKRHNTLTQHADESFGKIRKNQRHFRSTRNFVSNEKWQLDNHWPVFLLESVEMTSLSDLPKIAFERDVNGVHTGGWKTGNFGRNREKKKKKQRQKKNRESFFRAKRKYPDGFYGNCEGYSCQRFASQLLCYHISVHVAWSNLRSETCFPLPKLPSEPSFCVESTFRMMFLFSERKLCNSEEFCENNMFDICHRVTQCPNLSVICWPFVTSLKRKS